MSDTIPSPTPESIPESPQHIAVADLGKFASVFAGIRQEHGLLSDVGALAENSLHQNTKKKLVETTEALEEAKIDAITGLPTRKVFEEHLNRFFDRNEEDGEEIDKTDRQGSVDELTVVFVDANGLNRVNKPGWHLGNKYLASIAKRLKGAVRPEDMVARIGGDEFAIIMANKMIEGGKELSKEQLIDRLHGAGSLAVEDAGIPESMYAGVSIGVGTRREGDTAEDLVRVAGLGCVSDKNKFYDDIIAKGGPDLQSRRRGTEFQESTLTHDL